ncbi:tol-pal system protein YbgF [Maridesulfovibrio sp.]|uniref:tol-pal system protein YbgF n=1 Tax=Maridesulfovibrio sp. TaxID=2795000 RepID=UPI002A18D84E|nr:tol-pal system protein YbgF [Maridesulfovibrio sp.]
MTNNPLKLTVTVLIFLILTCALPGCVTTSDMDSMRLELRQTRAQINKKIDNLDKQLRESDELLKNEIKESNSPLQSSQANMYAEFNALKIQVARLQGVVNTMSENLARMEAGNGNSTISLEDLSAKVENMRLALESQLAIDLGLIKATVPKDKATEAAISNATAAVGGISAVVAQQPKKTTPADPAKALYDKAMAQFKERKYKEAIRDWAEFSANFVKHTLVPNAIFWEGECYYQLGDYANAALKYQDVIAKYSKSNKYRSALLKQGLCLIKLGKTKSGRYILEDLIKKAPDSAEAKRAKSILKNLK